MMRTLKQTRMKRSGKATRQGRADAARLASLMSVAEAARVAMASTDDVVLVPRKLIEDLSVERTAEDAWRAERREPLKAKSSRSSYLPTDWVPNGWAQLLGGRAAA